MRAAITGATGAIGERLVAALTKRGDEVVALSRDAERARSKLGIKAVAWDPLSGPAPSEALAGFDAVINLMGEPLDRRWTDQAKREIHDSRVVGTRNLVAGIALAEPRPKILVNSSAVGYYGGRSDSREVTEADPAGGDYLAQVVREWEEAAQGAAEHGVRVVMLRTGIVLTHGHGALGKMLLPFKLGVGGPVAGGKQWMPWVHIDDVTRAYLFALDQDGASGPLNLCSPHAVTNGEFSKTLGEVLGRPAFTPVPSIALKALFGEMSSIVTTGQRAVPKRLAQLGFSFEHPDVEEALGSTVGKRSDPVRR